MYSKAGKISVEMFPWIQQSEQILHPNKKVKYSNPLFGDIPYSKGNYLSFRQSILATSPKNLLEKPNRSPFSQQTGRKSPKRSLDRYGFYKPKYHLVFKRTPLLEENCSRTIANRSPSSK